MSNPLTRSSRKRKRRERALKIGSAVDIDNGDRIYIYDSICAHCHREECEDRIFAVVICSEFMPLARVIRGRGTARRAPTGAVL